MNLGQTLVAILALVLLVTIAVNVNRARLSAIAGTIDTLVDQEAVNFGQNIIERVTQYAQSDADYNALETNYDDKLFSETFGSGRKLFARTEIDLIADADLPYTYKKLTVSVYADSTESSSSIRSQYSASFIPWWRYNW